MLALTSAHWGIFTTTYDPAGYLAHRAPLHDAQLHTLSELAQQHGFQLHFTANPHITNLPQHHYTRVFLLLSTNARPAPTPSHSPSLSPMHSSPLPPITLQEHGWNFLDHTPTLITPPITPTQRPSSTEVQIQQTLPPYTAMDIYTTTADEEDPPQIQDIAIPREGQLVTQTGVQDNQPRHLHPHLLTPSAGTPGCAVTNRLNSYREIETLLPLYDTIHIPHVTHLTQVAYAALPPPFQRDPPDDIADTTHIPLLAATLAPRTGYKSRPIGQPSHVNHHHLP